MAEVSKNSSSSISNSNANNDMISTNLNETESQPNNNSFTFLYEKLSSEKEVDSESNTVSRILNKEIEPTLKSEFSELSSGSDQQISCKKKNKDSEFSETK
ncbi:39787_t:CDS:2, partial [Gigaspora margarita]